MEELIDRIRHFMFEAIGFVRSRCWYTAAKMLRDAANLCDQVDRLEKKERKSKGEA